MDASAVVELVKQGPVAIVLTVAWVLYRDREAERARHLATIEAHQKAASEMQARHQAELLALTRQQLDAINHMGNQAAAVRQAVDQQEETLAEVNDSLREYLSRLPKPR